MKLFLKKGITYVLLSDYHVKTRAFAMSIHQTAYYVGIVVSDSLKNGAFDFLHASTSSGIIISHSREPYYNNRLVGASRVFNNTDFGVRGYCVWQGPRVGGKGGWTDLGFGFCTPSINSLTELFDSSYVSAM